MEGPRGELAAWNHSSHNNTGVLILDQAASLGTIVALSALFFTIGMIGMVGNVLVIFVILSNKKMRNSVTNLFIMNLAISDLLIIVFCIPDIVLFMINRGWLLGLSLCQFLRFIEVFALYASVMTLVSVCVERYIAIVHPMKAHILCSRSRILSCIFCIWPLSMMGAYPNIAYSRIHPITANFAPCIMAIPNPEGMIFYKYWEFLTFYLVPLILQISMYIVIGKHLFANTDSLHRNIDASAIGKEKVSDALKARRGVVKMLIAGVAVYFISFSPHQVLLFYSTFSESEFQETWACLILVNVMAYLSSAANPLLYSIFSHKFRRKFQQILCCYKGKKSRRFHRQSTSISFTTGSRYRCQSLRTAVGEV